MVLNENGNIVEGPQYEKTNRMRVSQYQEFMGTKEREKKLARFLPHLKQKQAEAKTQEAIARKLKQSNSSAVRDIFCNNTSANSKRCSK